MNSKPPTKPPRGREGLLQGLRDLCAERPGECLSQEEIAARCGVTRERIGQIERGALAKAFGKLRSAKHRKAIEEILPFNPRRHRSQNALH